MYAMSLGAPLESHDKKTVIIFPIKKRINTELVFLMEDELFKTLRTIPCQFATK